MKARTWAGGDNEPEDLPRLVDAFGDHWWCAKTERTSDQHHDGWRSDQMSYFEKAKTWWWLSMYRGPLREETSR